LMFSMSRLPFFYVDPCTSRSLLCRSVPLLCLPCHSCACLFLAIPTLIPSVLFPRDSVRIISRSVLIYSSAYQFRANPQLLGSSHSLIGSLRLIAAAIRCISIPSLLKAIPSLCVSMLFRFIAMLIHFFARLFTSISLQFLGASTLLRINSFLSYSVSKRILAIPALCKSISAFPCLVFAGQCRLRTPPLQPSSAP